MNQTTTSYRSIIILLLLIPGLPQACGNQDYHSIRDAKDWQNPYLIIQRDGVGIICRALSKVKVKISIDKLADYLKGLPEKAWPYRKVVGLQENGVRSGNDNELIARNSAETVKILNSLGIEFNWWPTA